MNFKIFNSAALDNRARFVTAIAFGGAVGVLLSALFFQYVVGLAPCELCLWQRWPHAAMALIALSLTLMAYDRTLLGIGWHGWAGLGAMAGLVNTGIAIFHSGVERKLWAGLERCGGGGVQGLSAEQLLERLKTAPVVRCDTIAWDFLGLSMANLNILASLGLMFLFLKARELAPRL